MSNELADGKTTTQQDIVDAWAAANRLKAASVARELRGPAVPVGERDVPPTDAELATLELYRDQLKPGEKLCTTPDGAVICIKSDDEIRLPHAVGSFTADDLIEAVAARAGWELHPILPPPIPEKPLHVQVAEARVPTWKGKMP